MEIAQKDDGRRGEFYIEDQGEKIAQMTYVWAGPHKIIIDHTEVSPVLKGKSIGSQLVKRAVDFAREKQIKILPLCPFAKKVFDKTSEYQDVLF
tara:strand:- start:296 stop:577 length:282 start_codon:yes stop_codon:yes gene_type:complete